MRRTVACLVEGSGFSRELADDVCAELWLEFFKRLERGEVKAAWPYVSCVLLDHARWRAIDAIRGGCRDALRNANFERRVQTVDDRSPPDWIAATEVWHAIEGLPEQHRAILLLVMDGFDSREIATLFGITEEAARQRIHRARVRFEEALRALHKPSDGHE